MNGILFIYTLIAIASYVIFLDPSNVGSAASIAGKKSLKDKPPQRSWADTINGKFICALKIILFDNMQF